MTAYRIVEHTADLAIESDGATAGEALAQAALALQLVLTGREARLHGAATQARRFTVDAPDQEALAVAFLSELIWILESDGLICIGCGVDVAGSTATAEGNFVPYDRTRHGHGVEVKAVTYHDLAFEERDGAWHLHVLLDI